MTQRLVFCVLLAASIVLLTSAPCVAGRDELIRNPNPDRTWGSVVGGMFTSGKSIAIVISITDYMAGYPALAAAKQDADKMVDFLIKDAGFDSVYLLTEDKATKGRIDKLMTEDLPKVVRSTDRFLFYWSGHGDQMLNADGQAFGFLPLATSKKAEFSGMVSMQDLARWDGYLTARQTLFVLDACLSGLAGQNTKGLPSWRLEQLSLPGRHLITAGTKDENVIASERWRGSLFTDSFILGAKGQAPSASPGIVSLHTLFDYIQGRVGFESRAVNWKGNLTPQFRTLQFGEGSFFFTTRVPSTSSTLPAPTAGLEAKGKPSEAELQQLPDLKKLAASDVKGDSAVENTAVRKTLGIELASMSDDLRKRYTIKGSVKGVVITGIDANSPAADKRLSPGDVIVEIAQEAVANADDLQAKIDKLQKDGRKSALILVAGADGELRFVALGFDRVVKKVLGIEFASMSDDLRKRYKIKNGVKGVVVTGFDGNSLASGKRLSPGDVIVEIAQEAVANADDLQAKIDKLQKDGRKSALVLVAGADGELRFVALNL
jgi:23S rRNA pseudoU1915 N3-methylase RlmH